MIGVCVLPFYFGETVHGVNVWYCVAAIAAINACFHIWGVLKLKKYSPGVVTGVLLYLPLFAMGGCCNRVSYLFSIQAREMTI
jgi:hypothetical protein